VGFTTGHQFSITGNLGHLFPGNPWLDLLVLV